MAEAETGTVPDSRVLNGQPVTEIEKVPTDGAWEIQQWNLSPTIKATYRDIPSLQVEQAIDSIVSDINALIASVTSCIATINADFPSARDYELLHLPVRRVQLLCFGPNFLAPNRREESAGAVETWMAQRMHSSIYETTLRSCGQLPLTVESVLTSDR